MKLNQNKPPALFQLLLLHHLVSAQEPLAQPQALAQLDQLLVLHLAHRFLLHLTRLLDKSQIPLMSQTAMEIVKLAKPRTNSQFIQEPKRDISALLVTSASLNQSARLQLEMLKKFQRE